MRGFLSLEPDEATLARLLATQNRLRDGLSRQGVSFPDRLGIVLIAWPFGDAVQIEEGATRLEGLMPPPVRLGPLAGRPNDARPAEVGFAAEGLEAFQTALFERLREPLDPDPPKPAFVRLVRVSPPSRKVGAALHTVERPDAGDFSPQSLAMWRQTPQGFEVCRTMAFDNGGP